MSIFNKMLLAASPTDDGSWDVANATQIAVQSIAQVTSGATGVSFKPDGTKMYVADNGTDDVFEYSLSPAWDITSLSLNGSYSDIDALQGVFFRPDGTQAWLSNNGDDTVREIALSTAWDITTATFVQDDTFGDNFPRGVFFRDDGLKMYRIGSALDNVDEYDLSSAWDISTSSLLQSFSVLSQTAVPTGLFFKPDGTRMFVSDSENNRIQQYELSTAWDVSTASFTKNISVSGVVQDLFFSDDGTRMFTGDGGGSVRQYTVSL